jgi:hypothetical protein
MARTGFPDQADRAGNAACKPARKAGVLDHEDKVTRETDSLLEGEGFEPSVPRLRSRIVGTASNCKFVANFRTQNAVEVGKMTIEGPNV